MQQQIQQVVAGGAILVQEPIQQEGSMQHRPHHVIQMADKRLPMFEMGVDENCEEIIILKRAAKGAGKGRCGQRNEKDAQGQRPNREAIHAIVILQRASIV